MREAREAWILFRTDSRTTPPSTRLRTVISEDLILFEVRSSPSVLTMRDSWLLQGSFSLLHA